MTTKNRREADQQTERRHMINNHVRERISLKRIGKGLSASNLGKYVNVWYQQIHFYERRKNQISSSALYHLSQALDVPVSLFFDGMTKFEDSDLIVLKTITDDLSDKINIFSVRNIK